MSVLDHVRVLRERWVFVVVGILVGLGVAGAHIALATPMYSTSSTFFIAAPNGDKGVTEAYQGSLLSEQKIKSYTQLVTDRRIREEVSRQLGSAVQPGAITASARPETVLLTISVADPSPARAQTISRLVAREFVNVVAEIERPIGSGEPAVTVREVQAAPVPTDPVSPKPVQAGVLGGLLGLLAGIGMAVGRHSLDRSVKSTEALVDLVGAPVLGSTVQDSSVRKAPLVLLDKPHAPLAEAFRQLRTNLQYVDLDNARKLIVVTSALAQEGKSLTTCNLAVGLAQGGAKVALVEADLRRPRAAEYLGMENAVGLTSVLTGQIDLASAMQPWRGGLLDFLGSGPLPPNPSELLASAQMGAVLDALNATYDVVLFDAAPTLPVADAAILAAQCHGVLLVTRYGKTSADQVRSAAEALRRVSATILGGVLTMTPASTSPSGYSYQYGYAPKPETNTHVMAGPAAASTAASPAVKQRKGLVLGRMKARKAARAQQTASLLEAVDLLKRIHGAGPAQPTEPIALAPSISFEGFPVSAEVVPMRPGQRVGRGQG